jgi:adenylate cyclase
MSEGILTIGLNGKIISINPAAGEILGVKQDKLIGTTFAEYFVGQPENDDFCQMVIDAIYGISLSHASMVSYFTGSILKKIYMKTSFLKDHAQKIGVVVVLNDISELSELRDAVKAMEEIKKLNMKLEMRNTLLQETFGRYLSDEIVKNLLESPDGLALGGKKRCITILMTDLRGFTCLIEEMDVENVVTMLNHYFGVMTDMVYKYGGTVIEFIGDAVLAIFGAPVDAERHADDAVACAVEMQMAMETINTWNKDNGFPFLEMGIGINTGDSIVGNIGSQKTTKYNVIGKQVNLCSRIESYTTGGQIMISESTHKAVKASVNVVQSIQVAPKGISEPIRIYQIDAIGDPYDLSIKTPADPMLVFDKPIGALCYRIRDKHVEPRAIPCFLQAISGKGAMISCDGLELFESLKVCLEGSGDTVLAKVISLSDRDSFQIKFTTDSLPFYNAVLET